MRTLSTAQAVIRDSLYRAERLRVQVREQGGGAWRNACDYGGINWVNSVTISDEVDAPCMTADIAFKREVGSFSISPFMQASGINRGLNPSSSFSSLLAANSEVKVEVDLVTMDAAGSDWVTVFHGRIDVVNPASGEEVTISCSDLGGALVTTFIEHQRTYCLTLVSTAYRGLRPFTPSTLMATGQYVVLTGGGGGNGHYYECTTAGTTHVSEDTANWPTTSGGTYTSGTAGFTQRGTYSAGSGWSLENLIQAILNDNLGSSAPTLYTPVSPGINMTPYVQEREPVMEAIRKLAGQIGWDVKYRWRAATSQYELTLFQPPRSNTTPDHTFGADDYEAVEGMTVDKAGIRNVVRVIYTASDSPLPAGGEYTRRTVEVSDSSSITQYGRLFCEIAEEESSNIDTSTEATAMANAILSDLSQPTAELGVSAYLFPQVETGDLYRFSANGRHFDTNQDLAVVGYSHEFQGGDTPIARTRLTCRGKPTGGFRRWLDREIVRKPGKLGHKFQGLTTSPTLTTVAIPGGVRLELAEGNKRTHWSEYEVHVGDSSTFTPSSSTLEALTRSKSVELTSLVPGVGKYVRVVPRGWNESKLMRAEASTATAITAGRAKAGHIASEVSMGLFPPNGTFEHATGDITAIPPDHWAVTGGTWGSSGDCYYGTDANGGRSVILRAVLGTNGLVSSLFPVRGRHFTMECVFRGMGAGAGFTGFNIVVHWYKDAAGTVSATSSTTMTEGTGPAGTWQTFSTGNNIRQAIPTDANFATVTLQKAGSNANLSVEVDHVNFIRADMPQEDWTAPSFGASGFTDFGGSTIGAAYMLDSMGFVHLRGLIKRTAGAPASGTTIFTLPAGYAPFGTISFPVITNTGVGQIDITSGGAVAYISGGVSYLSLANIAFRTT